LQASSSIVSIAQSSQDTLDALEDVKLSIPAEIPQVTRKSIGGGNDGKACTSVHRGPCINNTGDLQDTQLRILQSVAAHVKLLLDTPEHIWRLLEKKRHLHAGWLFLLARIIYQALVRDDTEDEGDWASFGIDIQVRGPAYGLPLPMFMTCHRSNSLSFSGSGMPSPRCGPKSRTRRLFPFVIQMRP
jgi:hypothetical protein